MRVILERIALAAALFLPLWSVEGGIILNPNYAAAPESLEGERLISELNCVACHKAEETTATRLNSRVAPHLGASGQRITADYLRKFLANPAEYKAGTTMPDMLHGLKPAEKAEAVEALTHYLLSVQGVVKTAAMGSESFQMDQGKALYHTIGCVACHEAFERPAALPGAAFNESELPRKGIPAMGQSIPLGDLARKTTVAEMTKFLLDPLKVRPSGRMPSFNLTPTEASSIAMYLLRGQAPGLEDANKLQKIKGLSYQYFQGGFDGGASFEKLKPLENGTIENFSLTPRKRDPNFGFRYSGYVRVPEAGKYTFYSLSDDGSRIYINGKLVVQNDGNHAPEERSGTIELSPGDHSIMVTFFNGGGGFELRVSYSGPGISKRQIPSDVLSHVGQPMMPVGYTVFTVDAAQAEKGKQLFGSMGCAACHFIGGDSALNAVAANLLRKLNPKEGCLADNVKGKAPKYDFTPEQRATLREAVMKIEEIGKPLAPALNVSQTMARLDCYACHTRNGRGGPNEARLAYFRVVGDAEMGDEGRIPPHLTGVGAKLKSDWIREVVLNKGAVRPYMATRMPQFGQNAISSLPIAFDKADSLPNAKTAPEVSSREAKLGRKLVGTGGLACITCHTFAGHKSLGIPALDMTTMAPRLKYDWFYRYLINPPSLRPGTRMPSFWPEGVAVNKDVLGGNTDAQIGALWAFLSASNPTDLPAGLVQGQMEVIADKEPVIYRHFIEGAGTRGIAVGYPEKVNLAFDANLMNLAMIWQGPFLDAARHRTGRGDGFIGPLGHNIVHLPAAPVVAVLIDSIAPWPTPSVEKNLRFRGYILDDARRPAFMYEIGGLKISDYLLPTPGEVDAFFRRRLDFESQNPVNNLWFRAAMGNQIVRGNDNNFIVDSRVNYRLPAEEAGAAVVRPNGAQKELLIPVRFQGNKATVVEEIIW